MAENGNLNGSINGSSAPGYRGTILVTDAGRGSAISIIRALGRSHWRVIAADSMPNSLGFRSRYAAETLVYPAPEQARHEFVAALLGAARDRHIDLIIPVTDAVIIPLSEARDRFEGVTKLAIPDQEALAIVTDKMKTLALAEQLGVPAPRTCLVATVQEALAQGPALGWPLVLKPARVASLPRTGRHGSIYGLLCRERPTAGRADGAL